MYDSKLPDVTDVLRTLNPYIPLMQFQENTAAHGKAYEPAEPGKYSAEYGRMPSPLYSKDGIRRISRNAGITEMMGFTADTDLLPMFVKI